MILFVILSLSMILYSSLLSELLSYFLLTFLLTSMFLLYMLLPVTHAMLIKHMVHMGHISDIWFFYLNFDLCPRGILLRCSRLFSCLQAQDFSLFWYYLHLSEDLI